jgi:hypothetical protein
MDYALATLKTFYKHVSPKPHLHVADDGSPGNYAAMLAAAGLKAGAPSVSTTNSERGGYGCNVNLATQVVHGLADYVVMLEDDWELLKPLDLASYVEDLDACPEIDCVRLGYLGWVGLRAAAQVHCARP